MLLRFPWGGVRLRRTLSDARLLARMLGYSLVLPLLKHLLPLPTLARLAWTPARRGSDDRQARVLELLYRLYRPRRLWPRPNCLERSLTGYRFLSEAGACPELWIGFMREADRLHGHAWLQVDGEVLREPVEHVRRFIPVAVFEAGARRRPALEPASEGKLSCR